MAITVEDIKKRSALADCNCNKHDLHQILTRGIPLLQWCCGSKAACRAFDWPGATYRRRWGSGAGEERMPSPAPYLQSLRTLF